jgi:polyferredoxin
VQGEFRRFKWIVMLITLGIYYLTPWLRWDRGPYAPDQAVLDRSRQSPLLFLLHRNLAAGILLRRGPAGHGGLGLFPVTSAVGRAWCGYTCPQTVWVDLFSSSNAPSKATAMPASNSTRHLGRLRQGLEAVAKHAIWMVIGSLTGGAWIFYFADAPKLLMDFVTVRPPRRLYHRRHPDRHHLCFRRADARAGLHLYVPVAAHPGGDAG